MISYFINNFCRAYTQYIQATIQFQGKNTNETRKLLEDIIKEDHTNYLKDF